MTLAGAECVRTQSRTGSGTRTGSCETAQSMLPRGIDLLSPGTCFRGYTSTRRCVPTSSGVGVYRGFFAPGMATKRSSCCCLLPATATPAPPRRSRDDGTIPLDGCDGRAFGSSTGVAAALPPADTDDAATDAGVDTAEPPTPPDTIPCASCTAPELAAPPASVDEGIAIGVTAAGPRPKLAAPTPAVALPAPAVVALPPSNSASLAASAAASSARSDLNHLNLQRNLSDPGGLRL